jgi:DegV family protein with EDD domain
MGLNIRIVTDSTCDLPENLVDRYHIVVIPNIIIVNGESYLDGKGISREEFYRRMVQNTALPSTATASAGTYQDTYHQLISQGAEHILSIHAASALTGIINSAQAGAENFDGKVTLIDSKQLSLGLGFQVLAAATAIQEGLGMDQILAKIQDTRRRLRVFAMLDTLEFAKRSGRISWARFRLASLLQIRPIIELSNGKVLNKGEYRTRTKSLAQLASLLQNLGNLEHLAILHTNAEEEAKSFFDNLSVFSQNQALFCNVTTTIGTHVGPHAIGFAAVMQKTADLSG